MKHQPALSRPLRSSVLSLARLRARLTPAVERPEANRAAVLPIADAPDPAAARVPRRRSLGRAWACRAASGRRAGRRAGRPGLCL